MLFLIYLKAMIINMPLYTFRDTDSGYEFEEFFTFSEKDEFLKENPSIVQVIGAPNIVSGISGITHKNDSGFNDLMNRIGNANPHSPLGEKYGNKGIKEAKTRQAVDRAKAKG